MGDLTVDNLLVKEDCRITGDARLGNSLFITRFSRVGPLAVQGAMTVSENATLAGDLTVDQDVEFKGSLSSIAPAAPTVNVALVMDGEGNSYPNATITVAGDDNVGKITLKLGEGEAGKIGNRTAFNVIFGRVKERVSQVVVTQRSSDFWGNLVPIVGASTNVGFACTLTEGFSADLTPQLSITLDYMCMGTSRALT